MTYTVRYYYQKTDGVFNNGKTKKVEHDIEVIDRYAARPCSEDSSLQPYKRVLVHVSEEEEWV